MFSTSVATYNDVTQTQRESGTQVLQTQAEAKYKCIDIELEI